MVSLHAVRRKAAVAKRYEQAMRRTRRGDETICALHWAFLLWQKLSADDVDKELRTALAEALKDALQRAIDWRQSTLIALPREAMQYDFPELLLLGRAAEAFRKEAAASGLDFDWFKADVPEQPLPEALMEAGLLTEADLQASREAFEKEWAKRGHGIGGGDDVPATPPTHGRPSPRDRARMARAKTDPISTNPQLVIPAQARIQKRFQGFHHSLLETGYMAIGTPYLVC